MVLRYRAPIVHVTVVLLLGFALVLGAVATPAVVRAQQATELEVYATGLVNPKGMAFGPDGTLYIAESGAPGDVMVPLPVNFGGEGPIGTNARISKVPPGGQREDFVTGLPNIGLYGGIEMLGAGSVAEMDGQLYEIAAGHMTISPTLSRVTSDGKMETIADVGAFNDLNPPPASNGDAVPRGNPYDMAALDGSLYFTDGNYNRVTRAGLDGSLEIIAQWENSPVTVGIAAGPDGNIYVSQFSPAPYTAGTGRIDRVTPDGEITEGVVTGLTTPIDIAFAPDGTMYVLRFASEFSAERLRYIAFGGAVLRVNPDGSATEIVTNLVFPTAMTFGPDGALYVTNYGNEANTGQGQVLRVIPGDTAVMGPMVEPPDETGSYSNAQPTATALTGVEPVMTINIIEPADAMQWGYDQPLVTIQAGQAITFTNTGQVVHTATAANGAFDTGSLRNGQSVTIKIDEPGEYDYFCQPHPWMKGKIIVLGEGSAGGAAGTSNDKGLDPPSINIWLATGLVVLIVAGLFGAGYAMRRRAPEPAPEPEPAPPPPPADTAQGEV